jgi:hypothetical protein
VGFEHPPGQNSGLRDISLTAALQELLLKVCLGGSGVGGLASWLGVLASWLGVLAGWLGVLASWAWGSG